MSTQTTSADPAKTNTETAQVELRGIGLLIREHAEGEDLSIRTLLANHPKLGSDQTLGRICAGQWDKVKAEDWLDAYRTVLEVIAGQANDAAPLYDDLSTAKKLRGQMSRLKLSRTLAKLIIVKGYTGSGKTSALKIVRDKYNAMGALQQVYDIEASEGFGDNPTAMLGEILSAIGCEPGPANKAKRLKRALSELSQREMMVTIDECHDLGAKSLRVLKTLLNRTAVKIVIACHPRLWRQLESDAADDLSQLTGNRLLAVIDLGTLCVGDAAIMVTRGVPALSGVAEVKFTALAEAALNNGNLGFVREVVVRLIKEAKKHPVLTLDDVTAATSAELKARGRAKK